LRAESTGLDAKKKERQDAERGANNTEGEAMSLEIVMLICTALLSLLLPVTYLIGRMQVPGGMEWALGNRDQPLEVAPWVARAERAHRNLVENLAPFAILVLSAYVTGRLSWLTGLGSVIFFLGRVAHAAVYIAGIPGVRTLTFFIAVFGELMILLQLLF
jgi:uncharacterized MAPEG superfamily protein